MSENEQKKERIDWRLVVNTPSGRVDSGRTSDGYQIQRRKRPGQRVVYTLPNEAREYTRLSDAVKAARRDA